MSTLSEPSSVFTDQDLLELILSRFIFETYSRMSFEDFLDDVHDELFYEYDEGVPGSASELLSRALLLGDQLAPHMWDFEEKTQTQLCRQQWNFHSSRTANLLAKNRGRVVFHEEPADPHLVGLDQEMSDSFSPEELVRMYTRDPLVMQWDGDDYYV